MKKIISTAFVFCFFCLYLYGQNNISIGDKSNDSTKYVDMDFEYSLSQLFHFLLNEEDELGFDVYKDLIFEEVDENFMLSEFDFVGYLEE